MKLITEAHMEDAQAPFYIMSNFAIGETNLTDFWRERLDQLKRDATPFQVVAGEEGPAIRLEVQEQSRLAQSLMPECDTFELWPTWCTFMTRDFSICETFLLLGVGRGDHWLVVRFEHERQMPLLCAIEETKQLELSCSSGEKLCTVRFADPELSEQLAEMKRIYAGKGLSH